MENTFSNEVCFYVEADDSLLKQCAKIELPLSLDFKKHITCLNNQNEYLEELVKDGLSRKYSEITPKIQERCNYELQIIYEKGFTDYFLILWEIVSWAKGNWDNVNKREKKTISIGPGCGTAGCSIVAYSLGITDIDPIQFNLPFERFYNPQIESFPNVNIDADFDCLKDISEHIHLLYGDNQIKNDTNVGVRFNFSGLKPLSVIRYAENVICKNIGAGESILNFNESDTNVFNLFKQGEMKDIYLFEDNGLKEIFCKLQPDKIENLWAIYALYRPGLMELIPEYIEAKNNPENFHYPDSCLESILKETYGLIIYQEQVMLIIQRITGFSLAKADLARRIMAKKNATDITKLKEEFIEAAGNKGFTKKHAENLFELLEERTVNAFNKSHAIACVKVAYKTAWLKVYYPKEFNEANEKYYNK